PRRPRRGDVEQSERCGRKLDGRSKLCTSDEKREAGGTDEGLARGARPHRLQDVDMSAADPAPLSEVDLLIIGGGVNGCGIARDAAGRGLSVLLVERDDLAAHTSSWSTKLIHGGLRYLEYYEFRLVSEALAEREVLLALAPHIIEPLAFVLPHEPHLRPKWMIRAGLFLY